MAGGYQYKYTLTDIFNNKALKDKIPLINYREREDDEGKMHRTTNMNSVGALVYNTAKSAARPFYKPFKPSKSGDLINIDGNIVGSHDAAFEAVFQAIKAQKRMIGYTANDMNLIRSALKEGQKTKRNSGKEPKLLLRVGSMRELENMNDSQIQYVMQDILGNIFYGDDFAETRKKFDLENVDDGTGRTFEARQDAWMKKVGY